MPHTIGASSGVPLGWPNTHLTAYSAISGAGLWYAVYYDGTNLVYRTSSDGATWSAASTINGGGSGPRADLQGSGDLLVDSTGKLHLVWSWDNGTGKSLYQQFDGTSWFATAVSTIGSGFQNSSGHLYESGGHVYIRVICAVVGSGAVFHATDPTSASSFAEDYTVDDPSAGRTLSDHVFAVETVGGHAIFVSTTTEATPELVYYDLGDAATFPGGPQFDKLATSALANASLDNTGFTTCVDGAGNLHVLYRISGTGWEEATYNGTSWTTGTTVTGMADNDRYPALVCDGSGTLHCFFAKYNAASDYGIGHTQKASGGSWTAQTDLVTHDATNRRQVGVSRAVGNSAALVVWYDGTNVIGDLVSFSGGGGLSLTAGTAAAIATAGASALSVAVALSAGTGAATATAAASGLAVSVALSAATSPASALSGAATLGGTGTIALTAPTAAASASASAALLSVAVPLSAATAPATATTGAAALTLGFALTASPASASASATAALLTVQAALLAATASASATASPAALLLVAVALAAPTAAALASARLAVLVLVAPLVYGHATASDRAAAPVTASDRLAASVITSDR